MATEGYRASGTSLVGGSRAPKQACAPFYLPQTSYVGKKHDLRGAAMLTVDNEEFWRGLTPVSFGELPHLQDQVTVIG